MNSFWVRINVFLLVWLFGIRRFFKLVSELHRSMRIFVTRDNPGLFLFDSATLLFMSCARERVPSGVYSELRVFSKEFEALDPSVAGVAH